MAIISLKFAFFVLISLLIYYILPGKLQNLFLLLASYYYYSTWSWTYVAVLLALTVFNFYYARVVAKAPRKNRKPMWICQSAPDNLAVPAFVTTLAFKTAPGAAKLIFLLNGGSPPAASHFLSHS